MGDFREFVETLFALDDIIEFRPIGQRGAPQRWWTRDRFISGEGYIRKLTQPPNYCNAYFGVCPRPGTGKGKQEDITTVRCLWQDIDDCGPVDALERVEAAGFPSPSITVSSGRGAHMYWMLDPVVTITTDDDRRRVTSTMAAMAKLWSGDHTQDLSRVLRLPGFDNVKDHKNLKPCIIHDLNDDTFTLNELRGFLTFTETPVTTTSATAEANDTPVPQDAAERARRKLSELTDDRSKRDFRVVRELVKTGAGLESIRKTVSGLSKFDEHPEDVDRCYHKALASTEAVSSSPVPTTDMELAERLVTLYGDRLRYCGQMGWLTWSGTHWQRDEMGQAPVFAKQAVRNGYGSLGLVNDDKERKRLYAALRKAEHANRIRGILTLAESEQRIRVAADDLDGDEYLLNLTSGTFNLKTREHRPHNPDDMITKVAGCRYDPDAECPRWLQFLNEIFEGDRELVAFMQRAVGYTLTGDATEHCLFLCHGSGANGKSVFQQTVAAMMGDYCRQASAETFMVKRGGGANSDIARLAGVRYVPVVEVEEDRRLHESLVKSVTGGDSVVARFMYREFFEFRPEFKLWFGANHKPNIRGTDVGIWRRIHLVPFERVIPEADRDPHLTDTLRGELEGLLNWALAGCAAWLADGLRPPSKVMAATQEYRSEQDTFAAFMAECVERKPGHVETAADLFRAYKYHCEGVNERPKSQTWFGGELTKLGFEKMKDPDTRRVMYAGVAITFEPLRPAPVSETVRNS